MPQASPIEIRRDDRVLVASLVNPPVNALGAQLRAGLLDAVEEARRDPGIDAIVVTGGGRMFSAGADISEFGKPAAGVSLPNLLNMVEASPKPVVAAISGQALGGGLELALACHARLAVPSAMVGLPEVKLGIVPGAGGTQRLPRLVGVLEALRMITSGESITGERALGLGLIDALASEDRLVADAVAFAAQAATGVAKPIRVRDRVDKLVGPRTDRSPFDEFREANARRFRGFEAPEACIQCIEAACSLPFEEGLAFERATFLRLVGGPQAAAQRHAFFAEREAAKVPELAANATARSIHSIGVIGAGTMGVGIATTFLDAGLPVVIVEAKADALDRGLATVRRNYDASARRGRITSDDVETRMGLLTSALDIEALADCDLVVEAAFETMDVKRAIFSQLDRVMGPDMILATNTSYLDVDEIAAVTNRPEQVVGLHFFSPANVMRLLEIVRARETSDDVVATAMALARRIGKTGVLVRVCHGFVGNRMLARRRREADRLILEGAMPWDVDRVLRDFGFPMGPFEVSDLAGLDLGWARETSMGETVRQILCERDRRGQKTGAGFYDYDEERRPKPTPIVEDVILRLAERQGIARRAIPDAEIMERCLYPMVNEGAKILEEGIARRASDIDVVWLKGYGWPVYRGGPMHWADFVGLPEIVQRLRALEAEQGADFTPAPLLNRLAVEGRSFAELDKANRASA